MLNGEDKNLKKPKPLQVSEYIFLVVLLLAVALICKERIKEIVTGKTSTVYDERPYKPFGNQPD
ncbi:MAG: hypothetical protein EOP05_16415 [Proteobacteria bacterium]|nr:MAG: hypothetical protein EOP05_16415 [Pseudomonadota bacterium]